MIGILVLFTLTGLMWRATWFLRKAGYVTLGVIIGLVIGFFAGKATK